MKITRNSRLARLGIVVLAALLVEAISIVQYQRLHSIMAKERDIRSRMVLISMMNRIDGVLKLAEATMHENQLYLKRSLHNPDSVFRAMEYLIDDNPHVVGGCIAFVPDYYPSKGRLFEPYAVKEGGTIHTRQIAGPDHDYTLNEFYRRSVETGVPDWSDPYLYGEDPRSLATFSYPLTDESGEVVAVCGLDIDLSWVGDTLNASQHFPSSFGLILTRKGELVAGPPPSRASEARVQEAVSLLLAGAEESSDGEMSVRNLRMNHEPYWQIAQVYKTDEVFADMRRMRRQQLGLILLGLAILFFMIERFARNEAKLREATAEKARIGTELEVARKIQQEMLPKSFPDYIFGAVEPAREVGGDLFDFFRRDGKLFFCIGDVSGKGVPSAMLMSVTHSLFRMVSMKEESPARILSALNEQTCRGNDSNMFVTFFAGCLDLYTGKLHFANAGHDKPFLLRSGSAELLPVKSNFPLGVFPATEFEEQVCTLSPGDGLFLYTDGLTEAKNLERELFGRKRVQEALNAILSDAEMTPERAVRALSTAAHDFAGEAPQSDDLTMLLVQYTPGEIIRDHIALAGTTEDVTRLSGFVKEYLARLDLDRKTASGMRLALEEAVVNVMNYAYPAGEAGKVDIYADSNREEVRFTIVDSGAAFDPTAALPADTTLDVQSRPIGGLGILLTRKLMDSVSYTRKHGQNVLTLTKSIV